MLNLKSPIAGGVVVVRDVVSPSERAYDGRTSGWLTARLALNDAFLQTGVTVRSEAETFVEHQRLVSQPDFRFSISHSLKHAGCWLVRETRGRQQIGFDLESADRKVRPDLGSRLNTQGAEHLKFLERWSIRESIFKALDPKQQSLFLGDTIVIGNQTFEFKKQKIAGHFEVQHPVEDLIVSFAWI